MKSSTEIGIQSITITIRLHRRRRRTLDKKIDYRERLLVARFLCYFVGTRDWEYFLVLFSYVLVQRILRQKNS